MGIDGTVMDVPDSPANEERFGRSSGGRGDAAFPQIRKLSLVELGTHVETALAIGGYHDSEQKLVVQLFDKIPDDALLLEDRNFFSYDHWKELSLSYISQLCRPLVRIILPTFNKLRYLKILVRFMSKKTSVILTATILTLPILAVAVPAPVLAGIPGAPGAPGNPGKAGIGSHGRSANSGPGGNANDGTAIA